MLPRSRNFTYGAGSKLRSADLNDIQDAAISAKHGLITKWFAPIGGTQTNITVTGGKIVGGAGGHAAFMPLPSLLEGTTLVGLVMRAKGTGGAGNIVFTASIWAGDGTLYGAAAVTAVAPAAAYATFTSLAAPLPLVLTAGMTLVGDLTIATNLQEVAALGLVIARD